MNEDEGFTAFFTGRSRSSTCWQRSKSSSQGEDAGLRFVGDRNFAGGSVWGPRGSTRKPPGCGHRCMNDWRPAECWAPLNLSSLCHAGGLCPAAERRAEAGPRRAASEAERSGPRAGRNGAAGSCPWTQTAPGWRTVRLSGLSSCRGGSYDKSRVTFTIRFQSLLGAPAAYGGSRETS